MKTNAVNEVSREKQMKIMKYHVKTNEDIILYKKYHVKSMQREQKSTKFKNFKNRANMLNLRDKADKIWAIPLLYEMKKARKISEILTMFSCVSREISN